MAPSAAPAMALLVLAAPLAGALPLPITIINPPERVEVLLVATGAPARVEAGTGALAGLGWGCVPGVPCGQAGAGVESHRLTFDAQMPRNGPPCGDVQFFTVGQDTANGQRMRSAYFRACLARYDDGTVALSADGWSTVRGTVVHPAPPGPCLPGPLGPRSLHVGVVEMSGQIVDQDTTLTGTLAEARHC